MATTWVRDAGELGLAVRNARLLAGISQGELAADARVGRQWLVAFEAGDKLSAPFDMVMRLLRVLDLDVTLDPTIPARSGRGQPFVPKASEVLSRYEKSETR